MKIVPLSIALAVSFVSAITVLGVSSENYVYGTQFTVIYLGFGIGTSIVMYLYLPVFFELQTMSVFEVGNWLWVNRLSPLTVLSRFNRLVNPIKREIL